MKEGKNEMPDKIAKVTAVSIDIIYILGGLFAIFSLIGTIVSGYAFFIVKTLYNKIDEIKETLKYENSVHKELFDKVNTLSGKIIRIEADSLNLRRDHDKNHGGKK